MSDVRRDDELRALLALEAVGALDADERVELEAAIADRSDLRRELEELRRSADTLADAVSETPPPALRASVLDAIAATEQLPPAPIATPDRDRVPDRDAGAPVAPVVPISAGRRRRPWLVMGAAAAAVVALVAGVFVVRPLEDSGDDDSIAAVLEDPDAVTIDMPATPDGGLAAEISIVYSQAEDAVVLQATDLPDPAEDDVYQLWAIRNGTPEAVGVLFEPDGGDVELYLPGVDPASAEAWAVTQEPDGGSATPTLPILAVTA